MFQLSTCHAISMAASLALYASTLPTLAHEFKVGDLVIDNPWTRATPPGAQVAAGYARITNTGSEVDRLIGGSAEGASGVEVHEMMMDNNVMKMRALSDGLEIKPGETVELKPGSYHLMMLGLRGAYKEGEKVIGALTFEKAGSVDVEFAVEAIGAAGSHRDHGAASDHQGHSSGSHGKSN